MSFFAMPTKPVAKKPLPGKPQAVKPAQKNVVQKKPAPDKAKGLRLLKETPQASLVQKKPAPDKVENLAKEYLAELKEVDVDIRKGPRRDLRAPKTPSPAPPSPLKIVTHRCYGAGASRNHRLVETQLSTLYRHGVWFAKGGLAEVDVCPCGNIEDLVGSGWACCRPLSRQCLVISIAEA